MPKMDEYKGLVKKSEALQAEIVQKKSIADNLGRFREEYEKMQQRLEESLKELPNEKEIPELLTSIAAIANQNRLEVKKFLPGSETAKGFYAEVPVGLILTGLYHDIGKFFFDLSEMPRIVTVGNIKMKIVGGKATEKVLVSVDCQATTYRFLSAAQNPPAGK
jgi:type IV pilus assembly protein PilO